MNNVELMGINVAEWVEIAQQVEQLYHEVTMIENQIKNLLTIVEDPLSALGSINSLSDLSRVIRQGQVLSYAATNIEAQFGNMYERYTDIQGRIVDTSMLQQKYQDWSEQNADNVVAVLRASRIQEETILREETRLQTLTDISQNAEGRLQALQAGNLIAVEEGKSLQRLRQLIMANSQLHANYLAKEQEIKDVHAVKWEQSMGGETTNNTDGNSTLNLVF
jgi:P-type conjugative transfer protein TrbJ